jgi:hypothetical protein
MVHWEWEALGNSSSAVPRAFGEEPSRRLDYATFLFSKKPYEEELRYGNL